MDGLPVSVYRMINKYIPISSIELKRDSYHESSGKPPLDRKPSFGGRVYKRKKFRWGWSVPNRRQIMNLVSFKHVIDGIHCCF